MSNLQEMAVRFSNIYPDEVFIEMVDLLDDPEYWANLEYDKLSEEECLGVLHRLSSMYSEWNYA